MLEVKSAIIAIFECSISVKVIVFRMIFFNGTIMLTFTIFCLLVGYGSCDVEVLGNAKNVILVVANGMSAASVTSARIQEAKQWRNSSHLLSFEAFPHYGVLKSYDNKFNHGNQVNCQSPLFYGAYNPSGNFNEDKTLFTSAQKSKKSMGLVTTVELENLLSTFNQVGLSKCSESNGHNCSDTYCLILYNCLGIEVDVIIGKKSGPVHSEDTGCDCFHNFGHNTTEQMTPRRLFVNRSEEFEKIEPREGVKLFGLFSEKDSMKNNTGEKLSMLNLTNVVEKSIKILSNNPNGYFMVVMVNYSDVIRTVRVASELSESIRRATSMADTLLVVTSVNTFTERCKHGSIKNEFLKKSINSSSGNSMSVTNLNKNNDNVTSSLLQSLLITKSKVSHADVKVNRTEDPAKNYMDVPVYAFGPFPAKMPAVDDQANFGIKMMKILEAKPYEDIKFDSQIGVLDSDIFHKDIKAAMEEIDEMAKEMFNDWL